MTYSKKGLLIVCDLEGRITTVHYSRFNLKADNLKGKLFIEIFSDESIRKALDFFVEVKKSSASFGWELIFKHEYTTDPVYFGGALIEDTITIFGSITKVDYTNFASEMTRIQNEQINTIRALEKEKSELLGSKVNNNSSIYDELSRLNNELVAMQRELSKKNAEITRANNELKIHQEHLGSLVKTRTEELARVNDSLIKELKKQEQHELILQNSLEKEKELNEMRTRFIATTSHEFRTPLTAILLSVELLQRYMNKWNDEKKNEYFQSITISIGYLTKLLDDISTVSNIASGEISYRPGLVNLILCANECVDNAKLMLSDKHQLKLNYQTKQKEFYLDQKLMRFIFNNLLSNAIKYSPEGGTIELDVSTKESELKISISDKGIGIPKEELQNIFESFHRTKDAEIISGNGLGLSIVKRSVELHGGEISVQSEVGKGTIFVVKIPIRAN